MLTKVTGVVLAGGRGRRMGGAKPAARLAGRPMLAWPAAALATVCDEVAIVAKRGARLPVPDGAELWEEPAKPVHPLTGITHALERAGGAVLVCGADMPFVTPDALRTLLNAAGGGGAPAAVAIAGGVLQPVLGVYAPAALEPLRAAPTDCRLTDAVEALDPARVAFPPALVRSVDTPEELAAAEEELRGAA